MSLSSRRAAKRGLPEDAMSGQAEQEHDFWSFAWLNDMGDGLTCWREKTVAEPSVK